MSKREKIFIGLAVIMAIAFILSMFIRPKPVVIETNDPTIEYKLLYKTERLEHRQAVLEHRSTEKDLMSQISVLEQRKVQDSIKYYRDKESLLEMSIIDLTDEFIELFKNDTGQVILDLRTSGAYNAIASAMDLSYCNNEKRYLEDRVSILIMKEVNDKELISDMQMTIDTCGIKGQEIIALADSINIKKEEFELLYYTEKERFKMMRKQRNIAFIVTGGTILLAILAAK